MAGLELNNAVLYLLTSIVITYIDVLRLFGGELSLGHGVSTLIIKIEGNWWAFGLGHIEFINKVLERLHLEPYTRLY